MTHKNVRILTDDEEAALLKECPEWLRDVVLFTLNTGMRRGEILALEWSQVDLGLREVIINSLNGSRTIPLNEVATAVLTKLEKNRVSACVFSNKDGGKLTCGTLSRVYNAVLRRAGIVNSRFGDLRYTFTTKLVMNGVSHYIIAKLLGHMRVWSIIRIKLGKNQLKHGVEALDKSQGNW